MSDTKYSLKFSRRMGGNGTHWELMVYNAHDNTAQTYGIEGPPMGYQYTPKTHDLSSGVTLNICDDHVCYITQEQSERIAEIASAAEIHRSTGPSRAYVNGKVWNCQNWISSVFKQLELEGIVPKGITGELEAKHGDTAFEKDGLWHLSTATEAACEASSHTN